MIRLADERDAHAIAEVHVATWRAAYAGILPEAYLAALSVDEREAGWRARLSPTAANDGRRLWVACAPDIIGFLSSGPARDPDVPGGAEIYAIYVLPAHWGSGLGQGLITTARGELAPRYPSLTLWVLEANARARRFYAAAGFALDGATKQKRLGDGEFTEVRYRAV